MFCRKGTCMKTSTFILRSMLCSFPLLCLHISPTVPHLLLPTSMIYFVMNSLSSSALKLICAAVNTELKNFSSSTLKRSSCYWSCRFLAFFLTAVKLPPGWIILMQSLEEQLQQIYCITLNCFISLHSYLGYLLWLHFVHENSVAILHNLSYNLIQNLYRATLIVRSIRKDPST